MHANASDELGLGEHLSIVRDDNVGLWAAIAIDDTTLGPGLGGVRFARYPTRGAAAAEAQRLGRGMTLKNALAGLPYGGAKSVVLAHNGIEDRERLMQRFGTFIARLGGAYLPGVDMGTSDTDLQQMALGGAVVSCADSDPSPWTAAGVYAAMRVAAAYCTDADRLEGLRVLIQGVGHVGAELARLCAEAGAELLVSDVSAARAVAVAAAYHGRVIEPGDVLTTESDIFAPCATAKVLDQMTAAKVPTRLVVGAANDTLSDDAVAGILARRGICYVPDFLANAGGVIQIHAERVGWSRSQLEVAIAAIGDRTQDVLTASGPGQPPLDTAVARARALIDAARDLDALAR